MLHSAGNPVAMLEAIRNEAGGDWMKRWPISILFLTFLLGFAVQTCATYSIPASVLASIGQEGSSDSYRLTSIGGQASPIGFGQSGEYSLYQGFASLVSDNQPPLIAHTPPGLVVARMPLEIQAKVSDMPSGVDSVILWFREGGRTIFRRKAMQSISDSTYAATVSPSLVTEKGLAYYIEAQDVLGNTSTLPANAPSHLVTVRVWYNDLVCPFTLPARRYRMISLPGSTNGLPDSVLLDDLGSYDPARWRLGRWNAQSAACSSACYDEYPEIEDFAPGRAFWLICDEPHAFDFSGTNVDIARPYQVHLKQGWNQIATPFAFPTDWPSVEILYEGKNYPVGEQYVVGHDTIYVEDNLISYDGTYHSFESVLEPWRGYWIYNASTTDVDLLIPPVASIPEMKSLATPNISPLLKIDLKKNGSLVSQALAGLCYDASDAKDWLDLHAPPPIGSYSRVVLYDDGDAFVRSVKRRTSSGARWEVTVEASQKTPVSLDLEVISPIPATWQIAIYDPDLDLRITQDELPYAFDVTRAKTLWVVAGTDEYIDAYERGSGLHLRSRLLSATPNPFSNETAIRFFVARQSHVKLAAYSVSGRELARIASTRFEPGIHSVSWNGKTRDGRDISAGVYFIEFTCDTVHQTYKVVRLH